MAEKEGEGLFIGDIYILRWRNKTEMMPRSEISYASAEYSSRPIYLILGIAAIVVGAFSLYDSSFGVRIGLAIGIDPMAAAWALIAIGALLVLAYLGSRRVGVVLASSGGKLFVETRGRSRLELLSRIRADLAAFHQSATAPGEPAAVSSPPP